MKYTLSEAAAAAGCNKSTIQRAIKSGKISASKDAHGEYQIEPAELHRVYPPATTKRNESNETQREKKQSLRTDLERAIKDLEIKLAVSQATIERLEESSAAIRETKDILQETVQDLRRRLDQSEAARLALTDQRENRSKAAGWKFWTKRSS